MPGLRRAAGRAAARAGRAVLDPPLAALLAALIVTFIVRYAMSARDLDMGHDIANYLSTMNTLFGRDAAGFGLNRPPLIGLVLKPFAAAFGHLAGAKALGVAVSVGLAVPFHLLARRLCLPWTATAVTILFVLTPAYSELLAWGYLTMFGLLFTMFALHFLLLLLERPTRANILLTGICVSLTAGFHQLSLLYAVLMLALVFAVLAVSDRRRLVDRGRPLLWAVGVGIVLSLPYLPVYLRLVRLQAAAAGQSLGLTTMHQLRADLSFGTDVTLVPWLFFMIILPSVIGAVALRCAWRQDRRAAAALAAVLLCSVGLVVLLLPPPFAELNRRAHYFLYFPLWLLAGIFLSQMWTRLADHTSTARLWLARLTVGVTVLALVAVTSFLSVRQFHRALDFYGYLDEDRWDAISWISHHAPQEGCVVTYPEPLGWWIEAEGGRNTANVADRGNAPLTYLGERSLLAERILSGNEGIDNGLLRLATMYPYTGAPGSPSLAVYAGGWYRDILMFDDGLFRVEMPTGEDRALADASRDRTVVSGDADAMTMACSYRMEGLTVIQETRLERDSGAASVSYHFSGAAAAAVRIPLLFAFNPSSIAVGWDGHSIEVVQDWPSVPDPVSTDIRISTREAVLKTAVAGDRLELSLTAVEDGAEIAFAFVVTGSGRGSTVGVSHWNAPQLLQEPALEHLPSAGYLAVDLAPASSAGDALPGSVDERLGACPYYELAYSEGDIRIYRVDYTQMH